MTEKDIDLSREQEDVVKKVGSVGAHHAKIALTKMSGQKAEMKVLSAKITTSDDLPRMIESVEETIFTAYTPLLGVFTGSIMIITPLKSSYILVDMILGQTPGTTTEMDQMGESALMETQNIIANSYLTALNNFMGISLIPSVPKIAKIRKGDLKIIINKALVAQKDQILTINTGFTVGEVKGFFLMILSMESLAPLLKAIEDRLGI